ncbi:MinD/ParA family protein [Paenibacillus gansuensis]|uniref:MinD/ParA family protein n=1 Tax=Paenibacillus gansuensis TaxID=306542 RepID=A0ABW5PCF8_9BACL
MSDQAQALRNMIQGRENGDYRQTKIITVTSGKGGVGKSNFTLNFALTLQSKGYQVLIFDADIGLANIDVLMGVSSKYSLYHLLKRERTIQEIIHTAPGGLQFIAGGSGFNDLLRLTEEELDFFASQVELLNGTVDYILFDTGAGLSKETLKFIVAADEAIVVTTPEPTSITDAYAIIKMVHSLGHKVKYRLVINRVSDFKEGKHTADKISMVAEQFLGLNIPALGFVYDDPNVSKAVKKQTPFTLSFPGSAASESIRQIVLQFLNGEKRLSAKQGGMKGFLQKMKNLLA